MNHVIANTVPFVAVVIAEITPTDATKLSVYGPLGLICLWLMWRDERQLKANSKIHEGVRDDNAKLREEFRNYTHQLKGLNRNLLYVTATHGPAGLRDVAEKELERINQQQSP